MTVCLWIGVTGLSPLIGWEHIKPHPDLKRFILIAILSVGSMVAIFMYRKREESFLLLEPIRSIRSFFKLPPAYSVGALFLLYYLTQLSSQIALHAAQETALFDFGIFDQVLWSAAHGHSLVTSVRGGLHIFVEHFKPILAAVALIYKFTNNANVLFAITTFIISSSLIATYLIAKTISRSHAVGLVFAICAFFYQPLINGINFPFHSQTLADPLLLFGFYFILKRRYLFALVSLGIALTCKENIVIMVMGISLFLIARKQKFGFVIILMTIAYLGVFLLFIEPNYHYEHHFRDKWTFFNHFFNWSREAWAKVLEPNPIVFLYRVFAPFLFLSFFCRRWFWLLGPTLAFHLLSNYAGFRLITAHYTAGLNALVFISAIEGFVSLTAGGFDTAPSGVGAFLQKLKNRTALGALLVFCAITFAGIPQMFTIDKNLHEASKADHQRMIQILENIPTHYSVMASERLTAHLTHRPYLFAFYQVFKETPLETMSQKPDLVVVDEERKDVRILNAVRDFKNQGYELILKSSFMSMYERPDLTPSVAQGWKSRWEEIALMPATPYRQYVRTFYQTVIWFTVILLFVWILIRTRWIYQGTT